MYAEIDNTNCKLDINSVNGELHSKVTLRADGGHIKTVNRLCCSIASRSVPAGTSAIGAEMISINLNL